MQQIYNLRPDSIGEVFVKYLEPIHVKQFLDNTNNPDPEAALLRLTQELDSI